MPDTLTAPVPSAVVESAPPSSASADAQTVAEMEAEALAIILAEDDKDGEPAASPDATPAPTANAADDTEPVKESSDAAGETPAEKGTSADEAQTSATKPTEEGAKKQEPETKEEMTAKKRIADAQMKMHEATKAFARVEKEKKALEAALKEKEEALAKVRPPEMAAADKFKAQLTAEELKVMEDNPDLPGIFGKLLSRIDSLESALSKKVTETIAAKEDADNQVAAEVRDNAWRHAILMEVPEFFEAIETPAFTKWRDDHGETVNTELAKYDRHDPKGALAVYRLYEQAQTPASKPSKQIASLPTNIKGQNGPKPGGNSTPKFQSREEMEAEAWADIEAKEKARR